MSKGKWKAKEQSGVAAVGNDALKVDDADPICGDCRFCQNKNESGKGECWRNPPILNGEHQQKQFVRPVVDLGSWCGEFERGEN